MTCIECGVDFVKEIHKVFKSGKTVRACMNAYKHRDHSCVHALCGDCFGMIFVKRSEDSPGNRISRSRFALACAANH